ncbi:hypothetical protein C5E44_32355 [Nocardia nova]|nr:hypothetical protein C5E44_32355 [Nocardia nova]
MLRQQVPTVSTGVCGEFDCGIAVFEIDDLHAQIPIRILAGDGRSLSHRRIDRAPRSAGESVR